MSQFKQNILENDVVRELLSNQNEAFRNCIKTFQNLTINELQNVSKVITELISTYKKTEKLLKKANVLLNDEVDKSPVKSERSNKKKVIKYRSDWMAPKRLLPKGMTDKDDDEFIKKQKDRGQEARGLSLRGLNDKPLRFKVNKSTCEVVKVNATNYTTEGNMRFKEMFPNGVDEKRVRKIVEKHNKKLKSMKKTTLFL